MKTNEMKAIMLWVVMTIVSVVFSGCQTEKVKVVADEAVEMNDQKDVSSVQADMKYVMPVMGNQSIAMELADVNTEEYNAKAENRFKLAQETPLSTFSIDVDAASYSNMRRFVNQGQLPPADAIRTEELINYFSYNYAKPTQHPVKISTEVGDCPWNTGHRLVRIGIKAKEIAGDNLPASNLVFLIDVSGSMYGPTRLELVKSSLKLLINNLREQDRVAIVVYAGSAGEVLPSTSGSNKQKIREALDNLTAGGSTAGGAGIQLAYAIAKKNFIEGGNNRIILCTDGDFNVGVSSTEGLESLIEKERKSGVFLTVLGYGMGNYKDNKMQVLAEKGNGNQAYIDNLQEANKVLVSEFGGTMYAVAKDVKLQIEFNPEQVQAYRLIGYESRLLNDKDFNDDTKDAGEMGAGHNVTAFYEIVPVGIKFTNAGSVDPLKYQKNTKPAQPATTGSKELLTIKLRYKEPDADASKKMELPVMDGRTNTVSSDFRFAAAVAMFGQLLGDSEFKGNATYDKVIALAKTALDNDEQGYRREFVRLAETVKGLN
ncbi:MAG: VWA domain-containing protein [Candidatus Symbiothrix sp.]|jgi:Ca-activated chloride channel family protein|nr:VWA domain-containing protein [Candidatus Symbiothrix sp.]